jgi:hypothetical protein
MILWDCTDCGKTRHAACGPVCLPAQRYSRNDFRAARIAAEIVESDDFEVA